MTRENSSDTDDTEPEEPTLSDRIEASDDFGAAIEQSTALLLQHRRLLLLLVLASLLIAGLVVAYPYLS